ncbi:MAG TPA: hypothetical protein QF517_03480 [Pseudomonadales bacterium]|nr:hypothetical protein [Pseudomonadales bacterium]
MLLRTTYYFNGLTAEVFNGLTAEVFNGLTAEVFNGLTAEVFNGLTAEVRLSSIRMLLVIGNSSRPDAVNLTRQTGCSNTKK